MENLYSYVTAKTRRSLSMPAKILTCKGFLRGRVLDFGCGHGDDANYLSELGIPCETYDPHFQPNCPDGEFDTVLCTYVLEYLLPEEIQTVLEHITGLLTPNGVAYISVHQDFKIDGWHYYDAFRRYYQHNVYLALPIVYKTHKFCIYRLKLEDI